jgi:ParB-like nuclease domain
MMGEDELQELAEDIKANGVREPVVVANIAGALMLVDGRNRRAACKITGVVSPRRDLNGEDPTAYVLSANIHRRHMTRGQRAMAIAVIHPNETGRNAKGGKLAKNLGLSSEYVRTARAVLAYSRTLADLVLSGARSLNDAYQETQLATGKHSAMGQRLKALRADRPDLADAVEAEETTLDEAVAKAAADAEQRKSTRWAITRNLIDAVRAVLAYSRTLVELVRSVHGHNCGAAQQYICSSTAKEAQS